MKQLGVPYQRRDDFVIAVAAIKLADEIDQRVVNHRALRQEDRHRRRKVREMHETQLLAEFPVIARLRLLDALEVFLQFLLIRPCGSVDALQHRVALIAAPVGPRD